MKMGSEHSERVAVPGYRDGFNKIPNMIGLCKSRVSRQTCETGLFLINAFEAIADPVGIGICSHVHGFALCVYLQGVHCKVEAVQRL